MGRRKYTRISRSHANLDSHSSDSQRAPLATSKTNSSVSSFSISSFDASHEGGRCPSPARVTRKSGSCRATVPKRVDRTHRKNNPKSSAGYIAALRRPKNACDTTTAPLTPDEEGNVMTALFSDLIKGSRTVAISPRNCVPVFPPRVSSSGLKRLEAWFCGRVTTGPSNGGGLVAGVGMAYVVELSTTYGADLRRIMLQLHPDNSAAGIEDLMASENVWYGVLDGVHGMKVLKMLAEKDPRRWGEIEWLVLILEGGPPLQI